MSLPQGIGLLEIRHKSAIGHLRTQQAKQVARNHQVRRCRELLVKRDKLLIKPREEHSQEHAAVPVEMETGRREKERALAAKQVEVETPTTGKRPSSRDHAM